MPQKRLYRGESTTFTFRMSSESRALLDFLAARDGTTPGHYVRALWERHLVDEGFDLTRGAETVLDPERDTPGGWIRDHTQHEERV